MNKLVSIIIPTYNRAAKLKRCLISLLKINYTPLEIIVVDNASEDQTVQMIQTRFPQVKLVKLTKNRGAVGGRNAGLKYARGHYICFIDSDNVFEKNFLCELVWLAKQNPKIAFVSPKTYYYQDPKRIWFAGVKISLITSHTKYIGINELDHGQHNKIQETDHTPNVWLARKKAIQKIGSLDEIYVMSYGEADWPRRAKLAGYKSLFCPTAIVYHDIAVPKNLKENIMVRSNDYRIYYFARNRIIFMRKFASHLQFLIFIMLFNNLFLLYYCYTFLKYGQSHLISTYFKGLYDGLRLIPKTKKLPSTT